MRIILAPTTVTLRSGYVPLAYIVDCVLPIDLRIATAWIQTLTFSSRLEMHGFLTFFTRSLDLVTNHGIALLSLSLCFWLVLAFYRSEARKVHFVANKCSYPLTRHNLAATYSLSWIHVPLRWGNSVCSRLSHIDRCWCQEG